MHKHMVIIGMKSTKEAKKKRKTPQLEKKVRAMLAKKEETEEGRQGGTKECKKIFEIL